MSRELTASELESALRSLAPSPARLACDRLDRDRLDRDQLMFEAGRASAERAAARTARRAWALVAAAVIVSFGVGWTGAAWRREQPPVVAGGEIRPIDPELPKERPREESGSRDESPRLPSNVIQETTHGNRDNPRPHNPRPRDAVAALDPDAWLTPAPSTGLAAADPPPSVGSLRRLLARGEL